MRFNLKRTPNKDDKLHTDCPRQTSLRTEAHISKKAEDWRAVCDLRITENLVSCATAIPDLDFSKIVLRVERTR